MPEANGKLLAVDGLNAWYGESHILHGMTFAVSKGENSTHGSDSPASAEREIKLNFAAEEIVG